MAKAKDSNSSAELIKQAISQIDGEIKDLTARREQLAKIIAGNGVQLPSRQRSAPSTKAAATASKPKRKFSAATRKKLKDAAKARWAKQREETQVEETS